MGKVVPESSSQSCASEAVFSKDGLVKKRIKNFETTIASTSDNVLVFPPIQTDADEINLPEILATVGAVEIENGNTGRLPKRRGTMLVAFIVAITFSWSIYSIFFHVDQTEMAELGSDDIELETSNLNNKSTNSIDELKSASNLLTKKSSWNSEDINVFLSSWNRLDEKQIKIVTATSWYHLLEYNAKKQLSVFQDANVAGSVKSKSEKSLMTLGLVTGILDQKNTSDSSIAATDSNSENYQQLLNELTSEIVHADKRSKSVAQREESESSLNEKLRRQYASKESVQTSNKKVIARIDNIPAKNTISKKDQSSKNTVSTNKRISISKNEIDTIVLNYKKAYEKGDLPLMAKLFGTSSQQPASYKKVASNFQSTFKNTKNRSINFYDTETHVSAGNAVVETKYNASVEFKNGKGIQYTVANVKFHLEKNGQALILNRVDVVDKKVNVIARQQSLPGSSHGMITSLDNKLTFPTAAELQDIATQLVTSYETGDLNRFLSLFSSEIKTNDRIDLDGVKKDYAELFQTTSDRQMFIQNLKWSNEKIGAKGIGDLEVIILSDEGSTVYSMEGKIQIVAQKIDNQVKITHLYHIEREK